MLSIDACDVSERNQMLCFAFENTIPTNCKMIAQIP